MLFNVTFIMINLGIILPVAPLYNIENQNQTFVELYQQSKPVNLRAGSVSIIQNPYNAICVCCAICHLLNCVDNLPRCTTNFYWVTSTTIK